MNTTKKPYNRKIGLNISHNLFKCTDKTTVKYLDYIFHNNEREAIGRRVLILIYILEGFSNREIMAKMECGKETVTRLRRQVSKNPTEEIDLLSFLSKVYYSQFPRKERKIYSGGSRTVSGTKTIFGLNEKEDSLPENFVPLYKKT